MRSDNPYVAYFVNQAKSKGHIQLGGSLPGFKMHECKKALDLAACLEDFTVLLYLLQKLGQNCQEQTILDTGANIMKDVAKGRNFRKSLEKRGKQGGVVFLNEVKTQMGGGQNRKEGVL